MGRLLYFKIFVLIAALIGIFYVINHLTPEKVATGLEQAGLEQPRSSGAAAAPAASAESLDLCRTRVHAIVWPDGRKIQELKDGLKLKWQASNLTPVDIGYMDMEKWLSLHCAVQVTPVQAAVSESFAPLVKFEYIDQTHEDLLRSPSGTYKFGPKTFTSPELETALADLVTLANLNPRGP